MWGYYWGFTAAQIDLLMLDQPIVVYDKIKNKGKKKGGRKSDDDFSKPSALKILQAQKRWEDSQREKGDTPIKIKF